MAVPFTRLLDANGVPIHDGQRVRVLKTTSRHPKGDEGVVIESVKPQKMIDVKLDGQSMDVAIKPENLEVTGFAEDGYWRPGRGAATSDPAKR